jgi:K+-sensing histidine kinase KdpD
MGADTESSDANPGATTERTTCLVPIRYPITDDSARTLAAGGRLANERSPANLVVLHVDLLHNQESTKTAELASAISATLDGVDARVTTRRGFLVEREILESAKQWNADVVVIGDGPGSTWRRPLQKLFGANRAIASYLREHAPPGMDVVEVDTTDGPAMLEQG